MFEFLDKFWLLILVVWLFILLLAACNFAEIAKTKGHSYGKYFAWCFFTGLIGWIMVIALPERADEVQTDLVEAEKTKVIKAVWVVITIIITIAMIIWIGISVNEAQEHEQKVKNASIKQYEYMLDKAEERLKELNNVSYYRRDSEWEEQHKNCQSLIIEYKIKLADLKAEN